MRSKFMEQEVKMDSGVVLPEMIRTKMIVRLILVNSLQILQGLPGI